MERVPDSPPKIPICILAGGGSRRFGEDKALAKLGDKPLIDHVLGRVEGQTSGPIAINAGRPSDFRAWDLPIITDTIWQGAGPLAGIHCAMEWARAQGFGRVVTLAVDLPFVPLDFVSQCAAQNAPAIARSNDRLHPVNGIWRVDQMGELGAYLESGKRSAHGWVEASEARHMVFDTLPGEIDPFWNVNTPQDLAQAEAWLAPRQSP